MRRPPPLPQSPTQPDAAPSSERSRRPAAATADEAADVDAQLTAPIIPLDAPSAVSSPFATSDPTTDAVGAAEHRRDPDETIRARDVWTAARARRKALRAEVRRFTGRQRRRRAIWLGVAASFLVLVAVTFGAAYSPLFAVEEITIVGASSLDTAAVEAALGDQVGVPLALVDDGDVKAALVGFPLVESYTLEARPPHELVVRIVERTPIGYIETRAGFTLVDAAGVGLTTVPAPGSDAPVLTIPGGVDTPAFEAAGRVMRSLPDTIRPQVTAVSATTPDDVRLTLGGANATIVWGSADDSAQKALVLERVMIARPPDSVSVYDVSSPEAVVVN
ncbi:FtsQ-type POTRA domain-containing protein [Microbacterium sp. SLBN-146]|uniref:FtsQ-type POTRA domain-containing protein n=1 Tax=Microbacterium sp. SLBN-146 TaxID=2768457 RepID=UPI001153AC30|nr:FtsQ-type POTRA domain-containing protein [Microbacterium sp. SLBN-146]TQJ32363.1 cell division protein FtsQ [Microbacterium sp. SLBN-146]